MAQAQPTIQDIPTPALVIDQAKVRRNINKLAQYAKQHHLRFRPHAKTHKSRWIARMQLQAGASGLTVAKLGEAQVMAKECQDILLAYPALDPTRTTGIAELAHMIAIHVAVDSKQAIDALADAARKTGSTIGILPDIDVGQHRTGVQTPQQALELAQHADRTIGVQNKGLFCYPGHIRIPVDQQAPALALVSHILQATLDLYKKSGLEASIISGGSSPTCYQSHLIPQYTEIRPGTNVFNDTSQAKAGFESWEDCAASVITTVISTAVPNQCVLDAGSKTLTSDRYFSNPQQGGFGTLIEYPTCTITHLSEEHAQVDLTSLTADQRRPQLGERLHIIPNHICPCINLQETVWLLNNDGQLEPLPIEARGMVI